jgi:hypothetical protein
LIHVLRRLLGISTGFTAEAALERARDWARAEGVRMEPPYRIINKVTGYQIISSADRIGGNFIVTVDCRDGSVRDSGGPTPR